MLHIDNYFFPIVKNSGKKEQSKSITLTENGSITVLPDANKVLSRVDITVAIPEYDGEVSE